MNLPLCTGPTVAPGSTHPGLPPGTYPTLGLTGNSATLGSAGSAVEKPFSTFTGADGMVTLAARGADRPPGGAGFQIEVGIVGGLDLAAVVAAAPDAGAFHLEVHALLERGAAVALGIHRLDIDQGDIGAVGVQSAGAGDGSHPQCHRRTDGVLALGGHRFSAGIGHGFDFAGLPRDIREREQVAVRDLAMPEGAAIDEKLDVLGVRGDVNRLPGSRGIRPMADAVRL